MAVAVPTDGQVGHARLAKLPPDGLVVEGELNKPAPLRASRRRPTHGFRRRHVQESRNPSDFSWVALEAAGIARRDDPGGCRWVAVRHAADHVHIVAVLAREDGDSIYDHKEGLDKKAVRAACVALECRYGLRATAPADRTAPKSPSRPERDRAKAQKVEPARVQLRRIVRAAAVESAGAGEFLARLRLNGKVVVKPRRGQAGELTGYAVGLTGDVDAQGQPFMYSGGKLAADLTLPKLTARWSRAPDEPTRLADPAARITALTEPAQAARETAAAVTGEQNDREGVAHATGDLLIAAAHVTERDPRGPLHRAADVYDWAARAPHNPVPSAGVNARALRRSARQLMRLRYLIGGKERDAAAELIDACMQVVMAIADYHEARQHHAAAAAAHQARAELRTWLDGRPAASTTARAQARTPAPTRPELPRRAGRRHAATPDAPTTGPHR